MDANKKAVLEAIERMWEEYPDLRIGQLVANVVTMASLPESHAAAAAAIWDIENPAFANAVAEHFARRKAGGL